MEVCGWKRGKAVSDGLLWLGGAFVMRNILRRLCVKISIANIKTAVCGVWHTAVLIIRSLFAYGFADQFFGIGQSIFHFCKFDAAAFNQGTGVVKYHFDLAFGFCNQHTQGQA